MEIQYIIIATLAMFVMVLVGIEPMLDVAERDAQYTYKRHCVQGESIACQLLREKINGQ